MRAAVVRRRAPVEQRPVSIEDVDPPEPGPSEVLIEVEVCGLCRTDLHMSPIPEIDYDDLYYERAILSVANNTREDGHRFLAEAARVGVETSVVTYALDQVGDALHDLKHDAIRCAAVIEINRPG